MWVYIIGFVVLFLLMWVMARNLGQVNAVFQEIAGELDFSTTGTGRTSREALSIAGTIDGVLVSAEFRNEAASTAGSGPERRYFTAFRADITDPPCNFTMTRRHRVDGVVSKFKGAEVRFDDTYFDHDVIARADDADVFRAYMTEDRRRVARNLILRFDECTVDHKAVNIERNGATIEPAALRDDLRLVAAAAARLNVDRP